MNRPSKRELEALKAFNPGWARCAPFLAAQIDQGDRSIWEDVFWKISSVINPQYYNTLQWQAICAQTYATSNAVHLAQSCAYQDALAALKRAQALFGIK